MPNECKDLPGTAADTVALVFDLVGTEFVRSPDRIAVALRSQEVKLALEKALFDEGMKLLKEEQKAGQLFDDEVAAKRMATAAATAVAKAGGEKVRQQIEQGEAYKRVQRGLKDLKCAWDKTPVGVWVDQNQGLLVVIASGVVLGSSVAMYSARAGDVPAAGLTYLANTKLKGIRLGSLTLGAEGLKFVPSKREIGGGLKLETKFLQRVSSEFSLQVSAKEGQLASAGGSAKATVPLGKALSGTGKASLSTDGYELMLAIDHKPKQGLSVNLSAWVLEKGGESRMGGGAGATYTRKVEGAQVSAFAKGKLEAVRAPGATAYGPGYEVSVGLGVSF